ncbi:MAG: diaminopimelate epimerase [Planctomycetes bacterium]|nr:diaminopimelate epimerase [Planctomycetota bacterium]
MRHSPENGTAIPFWKMEGCGNDYLYVELTTLAPELGRWVEQNAAALAPDMTDRNFGVGGDGLVLLAKDPTADVRMVMYNADGSRGATCGNALRCIAMHMGRDRVTIATDSGQVVARLVGELAEVEMGAPIFEAAAIPFVPAVADVRGGGGDTPWRIGMTLEGVQEGYVLSMGNPHCIAFVDDDPQTIDLPALARPLQAAPFFPDSCNVEIVRAVDGLLEQRTYERGTGETLACGSGACAVAVAAVHSGLRPHGTPIQIRLAGGSLTITYRTDGSLVMRGPARRVFEGSYRARR